MEMITNDNTCIVVPYHLAKNLLNVRGDLHMILRISTGIVLNCVLYKIVEFIIWIRNNNTLKIYIKML